MASRHHSEALYKKYSQLWLKIVTDMVAFPTNTSTVVTIFTFSPIIHLKLLFGH